ncbi:Lipase-3 domain-containing protein [Aphelenchoides besseyi]|nr:Lipase-3 domain-containing protein [Aphelenchoides besseyi]
MWFSVLFIVWKLFVTGSAFTFSTTYNETEANVLFRMNAGVYVQNPSRCIPITAPSQDNWILVTKKEVDCSRFPGNVCAFMVLRSDVQKQLLIVFRGTVGDAQLITEFLSLFTLPYEDFGSVNAYFHDAFITIWPLIASVLDDEQTKDYSVVFSGFSLGAALSTIAALKTVKEGHRSNEQIYLMTFGEPRVGDGKFAKNVDRNLKYVFRVVNRADLIPHLPPCASVGSLCFKLPFTSYHHVSNRK